MSWEWVWSVLGGASIGSGIGAIVSTLFVAYWKGKIELANAKELEQTKFELQRNLHEAFEEMKDKYQKTADEKAADIALYYKLKEILPADGSINYIDKHNMEGAFYRARLSQLDDYFTTWNRVDHKFYNVELDHGRIKLHESIEKYLEKVAEKTIPHPKIEGAFSIPSDWQYRNPELYERSVIELHALAEEVVKAYEVLIQTAREKLAI